jgi:hypothetical protein
LQDAAERVEASDRNGVGAIDVNGFALDIGCIGVSPNMEARLPWTP